MKKSIADMTTEERTALREESLAKRKALYAEFLEENPHGLKSFFQRLPETAKWNWYKSFKGETSKTNALKAKCMDCSNYQKTEITLCIVRSCPLYQYRPYQKVEEQGE